MKLTRVLFVSYLTLITVVLAACFYIGVIGR